MPSFIYPDLTSLTRKQKRINGQTTLQVTSRIGNTEINADEDIKVVGNRITLLRGNVVGIITHRYSPSKQLQVRFL